MDPYVTQHGASRSKPIQDFSEKFLLVMDLHAGGNDEAGEFVLYVGMKNHVPTVHYVVLFFDLRK